MLQRITNYGWNVGLEPTICTLQEIHSVKYRNSLILR